MKTSEAIIAFEVLTVFMGIHVYTNIKIKRGRNYDHERYRSVADCDITEYENDLEFEDLFG